MTSVARNAIFSMWKMQKGYVEWGSYTVVTLDVISNSSFDS